MTARPPSSARKHSSARDRPNSKPPAPLALSELPDWMVANDRSLATTAEISELVGIPPASLGSGLKRLRDKGMVFSPARGLYCFVPPEYREAGVTPGPLFIDRMMEFLDRGYYIALRSAVEIHRRMTIGEAPWGSQSEAQDSSERREAEASSTRPSAMPPTYPTNREFQVMVNRQLDMRSINGLVMRFVEDRHLIYAETQAITVPTGIAVISTPEQTAVDLVARPHLVGGLNAVADLLSFLPNLAGEELARVADHRPIAESRRLGYLVERFLPGVDLGALWEFCIRPTAGATKLDPNGPRKGPINNRWGLILNAEIEPTETLTT